MLTSESVAREELSQLVKLKESVSGEGEAPSWAERMELELDEENGRLPFAWRPAEDGDYAFVRVNKETLKYLRVDSEELKAH